MGKTKQELHRELEINTDYLYALRQTKLHRELKGRDTAEIEAEIAEVIEENKIIREAIKEVQ